MTTLAAPDAASTPALPVVRAAAIGDVALAALAGSGGRLDPVAGFGDAPYRRAGDRIVWIGVRVRTMHPRMVALDAEPAPGSSVRVVVDEALVPWRAPDLPADTRSVSHLRERALQMLEALAGGRWIDHPDVEPPRGFGQLLEGRRPPFPLDLAVARVRRFVGALAAGDPQLITDHAIPLLGLGTGLTPSGDDLVGGALFALRLLHGDAAETEALAMRILDAAPARTHAISVALLSDLAAGRTYQRLHDVIAALADPACPTDAVACRMDALGRIGHSSGWDMQAGLLAAIAPRRLLELIDRTA